MQLFDTITLGDARLTRDGYLVSEARIARAGIYTYSGREVGKPDVETVRVYRPDDEVFSTDALASFAHRPVTIDHPDEPVTAGNWKRHAVGTTGDVISKDGGFVRVPLTLMDAAAISIVSGGKRELSCGYTCDLAFTPGKTADGTEYDAVQKNIRGNHLAIVSAGRAGSDCRIGDEDADNKEPGMTLQKLTVDGITVEVSDTAFQVVSKLRDAHAKAVADALAKDTEIGTLKAEHAKSIETKDGEIAALKSQIPTADKLDALATERAELIGKAKAVLGDAFDPKGKDAAAIRKAVVEHALGDAAKGMTDAQIEGAFAVVGAGKAGSGSDPLREAIRTGDTRPTPDTATAYRGYLSHLQDAWKGASDQKGAA